MTCAGIKIFSILQLATHCNLEEFSIHKVSLLQVGRVTSQGMSDENPFQHFDNHVGNNYHSQKFFIFAQMRAVAGQRRAN